MEVVPASDSPSMRSRLVHRIGPLLGLLLFAGALWALHHQLKAYRFHDVIQSLKNLPGERFFAAMALTFLTEQSNDINYRLSNRWTVSPMDSCYDFSG